MQLILCLELWAAFYGVIHLNESSLLEDKTMNFDCSLNSEKNGHRGKGGKYIGCSQQRGALWSANNSIPQPQLRYHHSFSVKQLKILPFNNWAKAKLLCISASNWFFFRQKASIFGVREAYKRMQSHGHRPKRGCCWNPKSYWKSKGHVPQFSPFKFETSAPETFDFAVFTDRAKKNVLLNLFFLNV